MVDYMGMVRLISSSLTIYILFLQAHCQRTFSQSVIHSFKRQLWIFLLQSWSSISQCHHVLLQRKNYFHSTLTSPFGTSIVLGLACRPYPSRTCWCFTAISQSLEKLSCILFESIHRTDLFNVNCKEEMAKWHGFWLARSTIDSTCMYREVMSVSSLCTHHMNKE